MKFPSSNPGNQYSSHGSGRGPPPHHGGGNANTPVTTSIRNPYVKRSSIHSNFQNISAETDKFRKAAEQAASERQTLLQRLQNGKKQMNDLAQYIRQAQDELGGKQRELSILEREEKNLRERLTKERSILEELTKSIGSAQELDKNERRDFCTQMSAYNHELEHLLHEQEKERLTRLIHPENTLEDFLVGDDASGKDNGVVDDAQVKYRETIQANLDALKKSGAQYEQVMSQKDALIDQLQALRRRVVETQGVPGDGEESEMAPWTLDSLVELEKAWEEEMNSGEATPQMSFYSQGDESKDDATANSMEM